MSQTKGSDATKNKVGRPPAYNTAEQMQGIIEKYFKDCEGTKATDENGQYILTKYGYLYDKEPEPPTITGLALALGFNSRQSLLNYEGKNEFVDTITRAKARVEKYAESRLFDKDGANGAKFSLANNFKAWKEKQEVELTGNVIKVEITEE
jgi:hypothetical protein